MSTGPANGTLLVEAARWRLLELLFERPRENWYAEVHALSGEVGDPRLEAAARSAAAVTEGWYLSVFGPGGSVSPREVGYRTMADPGRILADLNSMYEAFGYRPAAEDPPDHVAVQAGFVGFMKLKQAYAAARLDSEGERATREAIARFIEEHLAGFAGELSRRLGLAGLEHMVRAALVLEEWCPPPARSRELLPVVNPSASVSLDEDDRFPSCDPGCAPRAPEL